MSINLDRPQVRARPRLELVRENVFQSNLQLVENRFQLVQRQMVFAALDPVNGRVGQTDFL